MLKTFGEDVGAFELLASVNGELSFHLSVMEFNERVLQPHGVSEHYLILLIRCELEEFTKDLHINIKQRLDSLIQEHD